ncbi:fluoride efflux transporter FluC [Adhaeretor mobilis]|uniref:Fluoride-specific ion channel FluC n=1 Tax=Adhaeretor mobilis TaxID=1930276 RepID=A0A517MQV0_9BACT|nr:CrcB family protein [Adhaeretor mobilis]QDS97254.1 Putative fluoride ion transporter CrcB [Adhaeretor mobilis]
MNVLAIAIGGALGAVCRHGVNVACKAWLGVNFAYGTLAVNVLGCFLLGLLIPLSGTTPSNARWSPAMHSALTIGFLGALTTFSTFGFETASHMENAQHHLAATNVALNLVLGVAAVFAGLILGRHFG